jgi:uncharacterized protein YbaA (DUF1428 family)
MGYFDGFVLAVPAANKERYRQHAADAAAIFKEFGVSRLVDAGATTCRMARSLTSSAPCRPSRRRSCCSPGWSIHPRLYADDANQKMMSDPRMKAMGADMPFDGKRMIFAGFEPWSTMAAAASPAISTPR